MKEYVLTISEQATHDLADIWLHVANDSPQVADKFLNLILEQCQLICSAPEIGRIRDELLPGIRSFPIKRYIVYYRVAAQSIEIIRILSGYRDIDSIF